MVKGKMHDEKPYAGKLFVMVVVTGVFEVLPKGTLVIMR